MTREVATEPPFFVVVFHVSVAEPFLMAEVPVPILPDVLVAVLAAAEFAAEVSTAGDNPVAPPEEVSWVLWLYCGFVVPSLVQF